MILFIALYKKEFIECAYESSCFGLNNEHVFVHVYLDMFSNWINMSTKMLYQWNGISMATAHEV